MHYGYKIIAPNRLGTFKNTFFVLQNFPSALFLFSPRTILKKMETMFIQTFPGQTKSLMIFFKCLLRAFLAMSADIDVSITCLNVLVNFFLFHSGGVVIYIAGRHKYDRRNVTYLCGKQANISFLIMGKTADIQAWGFRYHSYTEEFRENNGTKFLADFKALPEGSFLGI